MVNIFLLFGLLPLLLHRAAEIYVLVGRPLVNFALPPPCVPIEFFFKKKNSCAMMKENRENRMSYCSFSTQ